MKVLAFGEILWDIIEGENHLGGAPFNFAAHVVKCGGESAIISAVGSDQLGKQAIEEARMLGVDVSLMATLPDKPTGTVDVFLKDGQPDYTIHEAVAFDAIARPDVKRIQNNSYDVFYFGTLAQRGRETRASLQWILENVKFKHIFYDINIRKNYFSKEIVAYSLRHCTIFKINDAEAQTISNLFYNRFLPIEDFAKIIARDFDLEVIIITAADQGCYILKNNVFTHVSAEIIKLVDAVGAGDSFSAAFMTSYYNDHDEKKAALIANKVGGFVASSRGAIPAYSEEIISLLK